LSLFSKNSLVDILSNLFRLPVLLNFLYAIIHHNQQDSLFYIHFSIFTLPATIPPIYSPISHTTQNVHMNLKGKIVLTFPIIDFGV
jgi:hypothetical protein